MRSIRRRFERMANVAPHVGDDQRRGDMDRMIIDPRGEHVMQNPYHTAEEFRDLQKVYNVLPPSMKEKVRVDWKELVSSINKDEDLLEKRRFKEFVDRTFLDDQTTDWFERFGSYKWDKYKEMYPEYLDAKMKRARNILDLNARIARIMVRGRVETREEMVLLYLLQEEIDVDEHGVIDGSSFLGNLFKKRKKREQKLSGRVMVDDKAGSTGRPFNPLVALIHPALILQLIGAYGWTNEAIERLDFEGFQSSTLGREGGRDNKRRKITLQDTERWFREYESLKNDKIIEYKVISDKERSFVRERTQDLGWKARIRVLNYLNNLYFIHGMKPVEDLDQAFKTSRDDAFAHSFRKPYEKDISLFLPEVNRLRALRDPIMHEKNEDKKEQYNQHSILDDLFW